MSGVNVPMLTFSPEETGINNASHFASDLKGPMRN